MKINHSTPYGPRRAEVYPSTGEQLDAVFKLAQCLRDQGIALPDDVLQWISQCERVKTTYQKSTP